MAIASPTNTAIPLTENLDVRLEDMETGEVDGGGKGDTAGNGVDEKATDAQGYETTDLDIEDEQEPAAAKAPEPPDGGASWLVVAAAFTAMFFAVGMQYSQGSYIRAYYYTNHFGADSYFSISWVGAVNSVAFPMFAPFFGPLVGFLGPQIAAISGAAIQGLAFILASFAKTTWQMILSQGLIFGIGEVLIYMAGIAAIQQHFSKKRGLAVGLTMSGSGFGGLAVSIMCQSLIDAVGFAWSLRIVAFLLFGVGAVCGLLMRPLVPPGFRTRVKGKRGRILDFEVFKVKYFKLYYLSNGVAMFGYFVLSSYATSKGIPANLASLCLGLLNGSSAVGRIIAGYFGDRIGYLNIFVSCQIASALVCLLVWPFATNLAGVLVFAIAFGLLAGGYISVMPPMVVSLFGGGSAVSILGMQMSSGFFASLAGAPIAGAITDANTVTTEAGKAINWVPMIMYTGGTMFVGNLMLVWIRGDRTGWKWRVKI